MPTDAFAYCPPCSSLADKDGKAPLAPGLTKTDERSPLLMLCGDGNAKATRFAYAGKAQDGVKPVCKFYFGRANERFAAAVSAETCTAAAAAGPRRFSGGDEHVRRRRSRHVLGRLHRGTAPQPAAATRLRPAAVRCCSPRARTHGSGRATVWHAKEGPA